MHIRMDDREPSQLYDILTNRYNLQVTKERLDSGDYLFSDICIERKTTSDLMKSLRDGRLWEQLKVAKENFPRVWVLLEGGLPYSYDKASAVDEAKAIGGMMGVVMGWNIPVITTTNLDQTAKIINAAYHKSSADKTNYLKPIEKKHFTIEEVREDILCAVPGIGRGTAKEILKSLPSVTDIQASTDETLKKTTKRMGPKTIEWIRRAFS